LQVTPEIHATAAAAQDRARYLALATTHYENFPVGSWLLPRPARRHLHRIYAFARTADDLVDEHRDQGALAQFRADFLDHLADESLAVPLFADLRTSILDLDLPVVLFLQLLEAFEQDLHVDRYDEEKLFAYCRRSANPVGRLVLRVCGYCDPVMDRVSDFICTGLQLLNHLQDLREDYVERDRIYFPTEDLERFGVTEHDLGAARAADGVRLLVHAWTHRVADMFREGWPLVWLVRGRLSWELRAILNGAAAVLAQIRRRDCDVLAHHIRLGRGTKLGVLGRALLSSKMPRGFE
jgi:squalene synthase HpnC